LDFSNYLKIKNKIPANVNLLAVSKGFQSEQIKIINNLGQNDFGESKFQEFFEKQEILKYLEDLKWHFIGRLQSNKIRKIVKNFKYIHSVDSYEKLEKISNVSLEEMKNPSIMLQVKLTDDPTKGGFDPKLLIEKWKEIKEFKNVSITGLMTINPKGLSSKENIELFKKCRSLADSLQLPDCSMGMSCDWEEAIDAGSTWVRLGSIIFGNRTNY
tara:strand:- start:1653 stop:2294 length:642 start_codon:yes stop_codon:yes gene_type:complete